MYRLYRFHEENTLDPTALKQPGNDNDDDNNNNNNNTNTNTNSNTTNNNDNNTKLNTSITTTSTMLIGDNNSSALLSYKGQWEWGRKGLMQRRGGGVGGGRVKGWIWSFFLLQVGDEPGLQEVKGGGFALLGNTVLLHFTAFY